MNYRAMDSEYQKYFRIFSQVSRAVHLGEDTSGILRCIVEGITESLKARGCIYWIIDQEKQSIENKVFCGFDYRSLSETDYRTLMQIFAPDSGKPVIIENARDDIRIPNFERLGKKRVKTIIGLPVPIVDNWMGILAVYFFSGKDPSGAELDFLTALGEQGALALHRSLRYDESMLRTFRETVEGLVLAIEAKDPQTHGHSKSVAELARFTAREMNLSEKKVETIFHAALLHDIGKIGMTDEILKKLGKLSRREMNTLKNHPVLGAEILAPLSFMNHATMLIKHHHERFDGSGYPDRLKGDEIPLGARIISVCDIFETLLSGRAEMKPVSTAEAVMQIKEISGSKIDPVVTKALFGAIKNNPHLIKNKITPETTRLLNSEITSPSQAWNVTFPASF